MIVWEKMGVKTVKATIMVIPAFVYSFEKLRAFKYCTLNGKGKRHVRLWHNTN